MPTPQLSYPGVYVQEIPSGSRAITGVATAITAFVGRALRGPSDEPVQIGSFGEFERTFGGLWRGSGLGYAVRDYYLNGGGNAVVVRIAGEDADKAKTDANGLKFAAVGPGEWGNKLRVEITTQTEEEEQADAAAAAAAEQVKKAAAALERAREEQADAANKVQTPPKGAKRATLDEAKHEKDEALRRAEAELEDAQAAKDAADRAYQAELAIATDIATRQGVEPGDPFHLRVLEVVSQNETRDLEVWPNVTIGAGPRRVDRVLEGSAVLRAELPTAAGAVVRKRATDVGVTTGAKIIAGEIAAKKLTAVTIKNVEIPQPTIENGKVTGTISAGNITTGKVTGTFSGELVEGTTKLVECTDESGNIVECTDESGVKAKRIATFEKGTITKGELSGTVTDGILSGLNVTAVPFTAAEDPAKGASLKCTITNATLEGSCTVTAADVEDATIRDAERFTGGQKVESVPFRMVADLKDGHDGKVLEPSDYIGGEGDEYESKKSGLFALEKADLFTLLCLPPADPAGDLDELVWKAAVSFCARRNAFLLVDPPVNKSADKIGSWLSTTLSPDDIAARNAALYYPRLRCPDPLQEGAIDVFVPSGAIAGIMARTDTNRGVWKAPAGLEAGIAGASGLAVDLTDSENGRLPKSVNCLRTFRDAGSVVWGSRTVRGSDVLADEYKYVPVRRLSLFLKESLCRGTQWVVFEPNDEPLWSQIRTTIGAFMQDLFRQGAFQGRTPREAYFVKCDNETTTQYDIDRGIVNIQVGFAALKPAEFVVISIQQKSATTPA